MSNLTLPFSGKPTTPPAAALWLAIGNPHTLLRQRVAVDSNGYDCNDYAYQNMLALQKEGRTPYYVAANDEQGQGHMIVAYPTQDGTIYARDPRFAGGDVPLQRLIDFGYQPLSSSNAAAQIWNAWPSSP